MAGAPGRRVPGAVDGAELAVRAVIGQQVSVAGARTVAARVATALGRPLSDPRGTLRVTFPSAEALATADPALLPLPATRRRTVQALARAIAEQRLAVGAATERDELRERLLQIPGIGEWTVAYVLMRLGDTDAFPATDHGVRSALDRARRAGRGRGGYTPGRSLATLARLRGPAPVGRRAITVTARLRGVDRSPRSTIL